MFVIVAFCAFQFFVSFRRHHVSNTHTPNETHDTQYFSKCVTIKSIYKNDSTERGETKTKEEKEKEAE